MNKWWNVLTFICHNPIPEPKSRVPFFMGVLLASARNKGTLANISKKKLIYDLGWELGYDI